jgi:hypothetical protein
MPNESIYDGKRLAQPDELANYGTGDGVEKAITLANILCSREDQKELTLNIAGEKVILADGRKEYSFSSSKGFTKTALLSRQEIL